MKREIKKLKLKVKSAQVLSNSQLGSAAGGTAITVSCGSTGLCGIAGTNKCFAF